MKLDRDELRILAEVSVAAEDEEGPRPILQCVHIAGTAKGLSLTASDTYIWVRRYLSCDVPQSFVRQSVCIPAGALGKVARQALRSSRLPAESEIDETMLSIEWGDVTASTAILTAYQPAPGREWPINAESKIHRAPEPIDELILTPSLLVRARRALGLAEDNTQVRLTFSGPENPIRMTPRRGDDYALIMPARWQ